MGNYIGFMHLEKILVKEGDILNGQQNVGIIGNSGTDPERPMAKHLHLQLETELPSDGALIRGFDKYADPTDPIAIINKYGIMCQNDVTQPYWNKYIYENGKSLNSTSICNGHHAGIDYSGNIDQPHESKYCYTPAGARCKVIATGSDPYDFPNWGGFGNYVIIEILGSKKDDQGEEMEKKYSYNIASLYELKKPPRYGDKLKAKFKEGTILWEMDKNGKLVKTDIKVHAGDELNVTREMKYTHPSDGSTYRYASFAANKNPKRYYVRVHKY